MFANLWTNIWGKRKFAASLNTIIHEDSVFVETDSVVYLLESLGILLGAVVVLEIVLFRHHHVFFSSTLQIYSIFLTSRQESAELCGRRCNFPSHYAEKWMIFSNFVPCIIIKVKTMAKQLEEQRNDFLLDVRAAVTRNQVVIMILYNAEEDEYLAMSNGYGIEFDEVLKSFCEMPFIGRVSPQRMGWILWWCGIGWDLWIWVGGWNGANLNSWLLYHAIRRNRAIKNWRFSHVLCFLFALRLKPLPD